MIDSKQDIKTLFEISRCARLNEGDKLSVQFPIVLQTKSNPFITYRRSIFIKNVTKTCFTN